MKEELVKRIIEKGKFQKNNIPISPMGIHYFLPTPQGAIIRFMYKTAKIAHSVENFRKGKTSGGQFLKDVSLTGISLVPGVGYLSTIGELGLDLFSETTEIQYEKLMNMDVDQLTNLEKELDQKTLETK